MQSMQNSLVSIDYRAVKLRGVFGCVESWGSNCIHSLAFVLLHTMPQSLW